MKLLEPRRTQSGRAFRTWHLPIQAGLGFLLCCTLHHAAAVPLGEAALHATSSVDGDKYTLGNRSLSAAFSVRAGHMDDLHFEDRLHRRQIDLGSPFTLTLAGGTKLMLANMRVSGEVATQDLQASATATRAVEHFAGKQTCVTLDAPQLQGQVLWCLVLRDDSRYIRETLTIKAGARPVPVGEVRLLGFHDADATVSGTVAGSPVVDATTYYGFEHPLSKSSVNAGDVTASIKRVLPIAPQQSVTYSAVIGVSEPGQMRRSFLAYVERERAHPYRAFLTYNSWYDLGYGERYNEAGAIDRVHAFGEELTRKRGVKLDSFLFDDGWDNPRSLWQFDPGFPNGFTPVSKAASAYGAGVGVWLSPWGGYDEAKKQRIAYGRERGYEIVKDGYALSGPRYYKAFEDACGEMVNKYHVNQFKFDGTGNADQVFPGSAFDSDFSAAIHLISRLRALEPGIFINLTTGTYPSPFWLQYADSIWRGGEDHDFTGVGDWRQKWITYRDAQTYKNIVKGGPLFPLNSLMLHGVLYAREAKHMGQGTDPAAQVDGDFADEVWTDFGSGTDLQELYVTPSLLNQQNWDQVAAAARWARSNSEVLRDTHWIGGDPGTLEVYGWAAWTATKGTIVLRNPADHAQTFTLDTQAAFDLPAGAPRRYTVTNPRGGSGKVPAGLDAGKPLVIKLEPFEVITMEAHPQA